MIVAAHAHPVIDAAALGRGPAAVRLLGEGYVLWRDADGAAHAAPDRCPHRGTPLSLGRVLEGHLECAYHGWQFAVDGRCVRVPALPDFTPPASHGLTTWPLTEAYGLLWLQLEGSDSASMALPAFGADADPHLRKLNVGPCDVATSAPRVVENFLDLAHFGFVHDGLLGDRAHGAVADYRIEPTPRGFAATDCRACQPRSNRLSHEGSEVLYRYELTAPYSAVLTKLPQRQNGYRDEIALFVCPVEHEHSRVWFRLAVTDFDSSDDELRAFQHRIFEQDRPVLEAQRPQRLPLAGEVHSAADRSSTTYRRWLAEHGVTFGVC